MSWNFEFTAATPDEAVKTVGARASTYGLPNDVRDAVQGVIKLLPGPLRFNDPDFPYRIYVKSMGTPSSNSPPQSPANKIEIEVKLIDKGIDNTRD